MSSAADATIDALRSGHDELVVLVADLGPAELTGPSRCSSWDLSQVLSHLGSGAEISLGTLNRALDPTATSVPNTEIWDRWNAMSPIDRLAGFLSIDERLVEAYEALEAPTRENLRIDLGFLPEPVDVATAAGFRLSEFALHSWDVRASFDPAATVADEATPLVFDRVAALLGWIGHADAVEGKVALLVETSDPVRRFGLAIGDAVSIGDVPEAADGTLSLPAEAWLRLATGRLTPDRTPADVSLTSDAVSLDDLRRVFPGY
ncbi:MAG: hypothetical protein QOJ11_99 [Frankiales bacterium]|jgi:uncharacterized protein (TIGR03083 family)|nr:hypothetical protein [Frankiales bacterium]